MSKQAIEVINQQLGMLEAFVSEAGQPAGDVSPAMARRAISMVGEAIIDLEIETLRQLPAVVPFTPANVRAYLDATIRYWRLWVGDATDQRGEIAAYYVDAYQSVRISLFGETLPEER